MESESAARVVVWGGQFGGRARLMVRGRWKRKAEGGGLVTGMANEKGNQYRVMGAKKRYQRKRKTSGPGKSK